uniref:Translocon at the inner envelope membrane of chloroplasts 214 n=1 Tax=Nitellopsis obtusa TaxID=40811 RepID=A0A8F6YEU6_9VIRI|nr:hypothetical protein RF1 [Nitellopsis obtusa]
MIPIYPAQPMICLGILYGFLTLFCVTPSQIICARAFFIKGDSAGSIALIGSLIGQFFLVLLIISPFGIVWNRCYFGFLLTSVWFLWRTQKQFHLRSLKYESSSEFSFSSKLILFTDSFIFQLLNPIALPNSICYRIITPILFRYSTHWSFFISLIIGLMISNFFFIQITRNLRNRIEYDALKTYQFIVPSLNNMFINFLWSIILISLSRFTWGSYQDAFIKKDRWYRPLRLEKLRLKARTSDYFFDNFILADKRRKIFSRYLPKWSNLIHEIENYTSIHNLLEQYKNDSKVIDNSIQKYDNFQTNWEKAINKISKKQNLIPLPINNNNNFSFSSNISKLDFQNYVRRDLVLLRSKRPFNYIGYIQKWLSNNWNQDIKQVIFLPFPWEPLTHDECNEAFFLLEQSNKKLVQMLANQKLRNKLFQYKENTIQDLPGTPLASKKHNQKLQKWQREVESLPVKFGIRNLKLLRFYIQKQRQEDLFKKSNSYFIRKNLLKLEPYYKQQISLQTLVKRNIAIYKLQKEYKSIIFPKQLLRYNKETIKLKKRNKRLKGTLKAKLRKKHENRYFAPFRYFYMFQVNKIRDNLLKTQENQISQGVSLVIALSDKEKRWLTGAQKSLHIRDLQKQQLKKQRDIAYKKSPFRWLANFVYTSNALLFLKLRKPILLTQATLKGIICFLLKKDFSFEEEMKDLDDCLYFIYDVEGNLMPSGKLPEWWFIHGFTLKRKFKDKNIENMKKKFPIKEKKQVENSSSFIIDQNRNQKHSKGYHKTKSNYTDLTKHLETSIFGINTKKVKSINDTIKLLEKYGNWKQKITKLIIFYLVRIVLFVQFQIIEINKVFFSLVIVFVRNFKAIPIYIKLYIFQLRQIPNILNLKKLFLKKSSFQSIQRFTIQKLTSLCKKNYSNIKNTTLLNKFSSNFDIWNLFNKKMLLFSKFFIDKMVNICFYNVYIYNLKKIFFKKDFFLSFSYIDFLERIYRSVIILSLDSYLAIKELSRKNACSVFSDIEKDKSTNSFMKVDKIESRCKLLLKDLENYRIFLSNLQKSLQVQRSYLNLLMKNYFQEMHSYNGKNVQFSVNRQNIGPIRIISQGGTISLQKKIELKNFVKNLQLSNTNRLLEAWLFRYTIYDNDLNKKIQPEIKITFCKTQKIEVKRKKMIEEYLHYLYSSIFGFKGELKKFFNNLINIHIDLTEYTIPFFKKNQINLNECSVFSFDHEKRQPFNYNLFVNNKTNYSEGMKNPLIKIEANNNSHFSYVVALKKISVQASNFHTNFSNLNNVNGFVGKYSSMLESSERFSSNKKIEVMKGIDDRSFQQVKINFNLAYQIFHSLFLQDISNFYYKILPNVILNSVCSRNQFYHFCNKNQMIVNQLKKISYKKRLFELRTILDNYLLPNYSIEDLVCMERVWFNYGKRYSTRQIFIDPWVPYRPKIFKNIVWIYKDSFFYKI